MGLVFNIQNHQINEILATSNIVWVLRNEILLSYLFFDSMKQKKRVWVELET